MEPEPRPVSARQASFSVEIYLKFGCPGCGHTLKRRFLEYLSNRESHCPRCSGKMVHLTRAKTTNEKKFEMSALRDFIDELEGQWSTLVNESLMMDSRPIELPESEP